MTNSLIILLSWIQLYRPSIVTGIVKDYVHNLYLEMCVAIAMIDNDIAN